MYKNISKIKITNNNKVINKKKEFVNTSFFITKSFKEN